MRKIIVKTHNESVYGLTYEADGWYITSEGRLEIYIKKQIIRRKTIAVFQYWNAVYFVQENENDKTTES